MSGPAGNEGATGTLWLVPNALDLGEGSELQDVLPLGVIRRAAALGHWAAEDARSCRAFLKRVDRVVPLAQPLQSIEVKELPRPRKGSAPPTAAAGRGGGGHDAGQALACDEWTALLAPLRAGLDMGLISEAGMPAVADPGAALVAAAHDSGLRVEPLSGPSSLILALAASGLNGQSFAFVGYLPQDTVERAARIRELEALSRRSGQTQIAIETPYRNAALLAALLQTLAPATRLSVSCGLTLPAGFTRSATVSRWRAQPMELPARVPAVFAWRG